MSIELSKAVSLGRESENISNNSFKNNTEKDTTYFTDNYIPVHPFESGFDVVDRLLPFHLWQIHDQDLDFRAKDKKRQENGKMTLVELDQCKLANERLILTETAGVEKLVTRYTTLMERLRKAQVRADDVSHHRIDDCSTCSSLLASIIV